MPLLLVALSLTTPALAQSPQGQKVLTFDLFAKFMAVWVLIGAVVSAIPLMAYSPLMGFSALIGGLIGAVITYFLTKILLDFLSKM